MRSGTLAVANADRQLPTHCGRSLREAPTLKADAQIEAAALRAVSAEMGPGHDHAALRIVLLYQGMLVLTRAGRLSDAYRAAVTAEFDRFRAQAKALSQK